MNAETLNRQIGNATKWSSVTEIVARMVSPITNMVLARLLTPQMFGVVATVNIIISFADMFTDAGFQKYLIQHEFTDENDRKDSITVAFWTNLLISIMLWILIVIFRDQLSSLVGNPGKGLVLAIACAVLPMTSFSSIQMALYKRDFDFKTLFYARIVGILIPLLVTVPLAVVLRNYWALIFGELAKQLANAIILTVRSSWKPRLYYSIGKMKEMFAFSMWTLFEQISIWLTNYIGTFIVGVYLSSYYVGLYKTSMTTVNQFTALITASITPVLFTTLSRVQSDRAQFGKYFFSFQKAMSILIAPMSVGIFIYRDLITRILLGSQWMEASMFIGLWGITSCLGILLNNFSSEAYRALGKPKLSLLAQVIHLLFLVPALLWAAPQGFAPLYWVRSLIRFQMYITQMIIMYVFIGISFGKMVKNIYPSIVSSLIMGLCGGWLQTISTSVIWQLISIVLCILVYAISINSFPSIRKDLLNLANRVPAESRIIGDVFIKKDK